MWTYNYLCHYGIVGQKWGVRRYQNEDGTLTEEGKHRYGNLENGSDPNERDKPQMNANPIYHPIMALKEGIIPGARDKRLEKARKAIEEEELTDRFTESELNKFSQVTNGSFRRLILKKMKKNPDMNYSRAYGSSFLQSTATSVVLVTAYNIILRSKPVQRKMQQFFTKYYKKKFGV